MALFYKYLPKLVLMAQFFPVDWFQGRLSTRNSQTRTTIFWGHVWIVVEKPYLKVQQFWTMHFSIKTFQSWFHTLNLRHMALIVSFDWVDKDAKKRVTGKNRPRVALAAVHFRNRYTKPLLRFVRWFHRMLHNKLRANSFCLEMIYFTYGILKWRIVSDAKLIPKD